MKRNAGFDDVKNCARCGCDHVGIEFTAFKRPVDVGDTGVQYNYWGICPYTGDPILMRRETITPEGMNSE